MCEQNRFKFKLKPGYVHELLICSRGWRKIFLFMKDRLELHLDKLFFYSSVMKNSR